MTHEDMIALFPAFHEITDVQLRSQALAAMALAAEKGGWTKETIALCPVTLNWENCKTSWIEHVNAVARLCLLAYGETAEYYQRNGVAFDRNVLVAGALLHDIGKLTEFQLRDGAVTHGGGFELMRHPLSGALLASQAGLPDKIVHLIATHSFEGENSYQTAESRFVRTIDMFVFTCSVEGLKKTGGR